ncbi:MAG: PG0541 family transporter-associated protein [Armatimonadota bacterium]
MADHQLGQGTLLVIVCETTLAERLTKVLDEIGVPGYTRFSGVSGIGQTGRHEGTAVWPGTNTIIFTFLADEGLVNDILERNEQVIADNYARRPGYRVFRLPAEALA